MTFSSIFTKCEHIQTYYKTSIYISNKSFIIRLGLSTLICVNTTEIVHWL